MNNEIMELAAQLGKTIKQDERIKKLDEVSAKYQKDEALHALIDEYNALYSALTEIYQSGKHDEAAERNIEERTNTVYEQIMQNPLMQEYQEAQNAVNALMEEVNAEITFQVTGNRPSTCSGSCDCCGHSCGDDCGDDCCGH